MCSTIRVDVSGSAFASRDINTNTPNRLVRIYNGRAKALSSQHVVLEVPIQALAKLFDNCITVS